MLVLFVDGVGWGADAAASNPFAAAQLPNVTRLLGRRPVLRTVSDAPERGPRRPALALDATMGVDGLPQSGTGQAALITGQNTARRLGRHSGPFPEPDVRAMLAAHSLWRDAIGHGAAAALATAYPQRLLDRVADGGGRLSSIARAAVQAGVRLRGPADVSDGAAVAPFLGPSPRATTGARPVVADVHAAGVALARLAAAHVLTVYEHFATDVAGHRGDMPSAVDTVERLDALIGGILASWADDDILVLMSDHGNLEDLTTHHHTRAPALGAWRGPASAGAAPASVTEVAPAIRRALGWSALDGFPAAH